MTSIVHVVLLCNSSSLVPLVRLKELLGPKAEKELAEWKFGLPADSMGLQSPELRSRTSMSPRGSTRVVDPRGPSWTLVDPRGPSWTLVDLGCKGGSSLYLSEPSLSTDVM
ncbi:hypothetical protein EYF80_064069 [Liparis tanakae]|uniref:Uncharacterized protein n=1 Tax=Liparis tanakae TaxID=230148 RepID=A0A4Z2EAE9_9TELE|nr:hypothetical protein EYF80_064069 [Liparis tanakae]